MKPTIQPLPSMAHLRLAIIARRSQEIGTDLQSCKRSVIRVACAFGLLAGCLILGTPAGLPAADARWTQNASTASLWTDSKWAVLPGQVVTYPNGTDSAADFANNNWTANQAISTVPGITIGVLRAGDWGGTLFMKNFGGTDPLTFAVSSGMPLIQCYNNRQSDGQGIIFNCPIAGNQGLLLEGYGISVSGEIVMKGANTYTGPTILDNNVTLWSRNGGQEMDATAEFKFAGGILIVEGSATFGSTTIAAGFSRIQSGGVTLNAISRETGGVINFDTSTFTTDTSDVNGILGGYATYANLDWAHSGASASDTAISAYTGYANINALGSTIADDATSNVRFNSTGSGGNVALEATVTTVNTLLHNTATAVTIGMAGKTLRLGPTGGILVNANGAAMTIGATVNDGVLTAGGTTDVAGDVIIINNNAAMVTVNAVVTNNGSGVVAFTKAGSGPATLATANTYSGDTTVGAGTLKLGSATALPNGSSAGNVKVNGTLDLNAKSVTINGLSGYGIVTTASAGAVTLTVGDNNATSTFKGVINNGGGSVALTKIGAGTITLAGNNTYTGVTTVNGGALCLGDGLRILWGSDPAPAGTATSSIVLNGGNLILNKRELTMPTFSTVVSGSGSLTKTGIGQCGFSGANTYEGDTIIEAGTYVCANATCIPKGAGKGNVIVNGLLDFKGQSIIINGLSGSGRVSDQGSSGTSTFTVGSNNVSSTFSGVITNGYLNANKIVALTKVGTGTLTLSGINRYTGATTVTEGELRVTGQIVHLATGALVASPITVGAGASLSGTGTIGGATVVNGTLFPGTSIGTLTFTNNLSLSGTTSMEINKTAATTDKIVMSSGTVTLGGNLTVVNLDGTLVKDDTFDLIDGTIAGAFSSYTLPSLAAGLAWDTSQLGLGGNGTIKVVCDGTLVASSGSGVSTCSGVGVGIGGSPTASGGSGTGYTYLWSPATALNDATLANPTASPTTTTAYTVTVTDSEGCTAVSSPVTVTVNLPTITFGASPHVCPGTTSANLAYTATTCAPDQYSIDFDAAAEAQGFSDVALTSLSASPITITVPGAAASATYNATLSVKNTTTGDVSASSAITVTVDAPPTITAQPTNLTVSAESPASFNVTTAGAGLTYQWQVSGDGGTTFTNISDTATNASYTNLSAALSDNGLQYQVIVTGTCSPATTSTPPALLTVIFSPKALVSGDATICLGGSTVISAALTGTAPWDVYWSDGITQTGVASSPATRSVSPGAVTVYTVTNLLDQNYTAFQSDLTGNATVTVNYSPAITVQPTNVAACANSPATFDVVATGAGLTYQWQVSGDGGTTFTNISDAATNASYMNPGVTAADNNNQYRVIISGACNPSATSAPPAVLTVNPIPTVSVGKTDITCNGGSDGAVIATYGSGTPGYQISLDGGAFAPATGSPQTFTGLGLGTHTVEVLDANGCSSGVQTTDPIGQPTAVTANAGVDVTSCASTAIQIGGSPTGSGGTGALTYLWSPATGLNDATLANPTASAAATTTYTVTVTDANGCTGTDSVLVNRSPTDPLSWVTGSANWDLTAIADRWQDATLTAAVYCNGHAVVFGEGATEASPVITLNALVSPASVSMNANTKHYTISGSGIISGAATLTKSGGGTLTLDTANIYTGSTIVSGGVLQVKRATALGNASVGTTNTAGALEISGGISIAEPMAINGTGVSGGGALRSTSGNNTLTGLLQIGSSSRINSDADTFNCARVESLVNNLTLTIGGSGDTILPGNGLAGASCALIKDGAGVLTITAACNHRSGTTNLSGTIRLGDSDVLNDQSDLAVNGTFDLNGFNESVDALFGNGSIIGGGTLTVGASSEVAGNFAGVISGTTALVKNGSLPLTLSGPNSYSGDTSISAGTLLLGASGVIPDGAGKGNVTVTGTLDLRAFSETINGLSGSGTVDTSNGGNPTLTVGANDQSSTFAGTIVNSLGSLALTKTGAGVLTLTGVNTYVGNTIVSAGTLLVNSPGSTAAGSAVTIALGATLGGTGTVMGGITVNAGGTLAPGASIGTFTNTSTAGVTFAADSTCLMEINLTNSPANADKLVVTAGTLTFGGTLVVTNLGPALTNGAVFDLFDALQGVSGMFSAISLPPLVGLAWDTSQLSVDGTVTVTDLTISPTGALPDGQKGSPYSQVISASGGDGGYSFTLSTGTLPPGLSLGSAGLLSGTPTNIGFYGFTVAVTDTNDCTGTQAYTLKVLPAVPDTNKPTVLITSPADKARVYHTPTNIIGTAKDAPVTTASGVYEVLYGVNGGPVTNLASGTTNWSATISMNPGTNTFTVKSKDLAGNESLSSTRTYILSITSQLSVSTNGYGGITPTTLIGLGTPTNGAMLELNRAYTVEAKKDTAGLGVNYVFSNWVASVDGGPAYVASTSPKYTFVMQTNLSLTAVFETNRFIQQSGFYYGLFFDEQTPMVAHQSAGLFMMTVSSRQLFSGKIFLDGNVAGFSGSLDLNGYGVSKPIYRMKTGTTYGKSTMQMTVQLAFDGSDSVTGSLMCLSNTVYQPVGPFTSSLTGFKAAFFKTGGPLATNYTGTNMKGGTYTLAVDVPSSSESPKGNTYGTVTLKTNGLALCVGNLGDYALLKPVVTYISKDGDWPLYATTYKATFIYTNQATGLPVVKYENKGSLIGWMKFTNHLGSEPTGRELLDSGSGLTLDWIKVAPSAPNTNAPKYFYDAFYGNGFTNHDLEFSASVFNPPANTKQERVLSVTNLQMVFADGDLASVSAHPDGKFTNYFSWNTNNVIKWNPLQPAILNTQLVSVVVTSGKLRGQFSHPAMTTLPRRLFSGVILQDELIGKGVFVGTNGSGSFLLKADE